MRNEKTEAQKLAIAAAKARARARARAQKYLNGLDQQAVAGMLGSCGGDVQMAASELGYESENCRRIREEMESAFDLVTVNGVVYDSEQNAKLVRDALIAEGIPHHHPASREAVKALRKQGVHRTPQVGEEWGCGVEFGRVEKFTSASRAIIRQTKVGGLVAIGETFELPIHVLMPKFIGDSL